MHATSPIERLPAELFLHIMQGLDSPIDLRSLISACPPALRYFRSLRYQVLSPTLTRFTNSFEEDESGQNNDLVAKALLAVRFRLAQANHGLHYLERETVKREVSRLLESPPPPPSSWQGNLAVFCELAHLIKDCEQCISRYARASWVKLAKETLQAATVWAGPKRPLPLVRFALTRSERRRFQEGFLQFDAYRHCLHYDDTLLLKVRPSEPIQESILLGGTKEGYKEPDWGTRAFQSFFRFIFDKHCRLVRYVDKELKATTRVETRSLDRQHTATLEEIRSNRVGQFLQRTRHEELRYVAFLCTHGYILLRNLESMDAECLQHFTVTTFLWKCLGEVQACRDPDKTTQNKHDQLGIALDILSAKYNWFQVDYHHDDSFDEFPDGFWDGAWNDDGCDDFFEDRVEPWSRGRYFWDKSRPKGVENRALHRTARAPRPSRWDRS